MRSAVEIGQVLDAMRADADVITASLDEGEVLFLSRLLAAEPVRGCILLACAENKPANTALLAEGAASFRCNHRGAHYEFTAGGAHETLQGENAAIRLDFPEALVALQRRSRKRVSVPPQVSLRCEAQLGPLSFEGSVVDISLGGIGALVYDPGVHLEPGTRILRARIVYPRHKPVIADLEVRHIRRVTLPDGSAANRAGCRIHADARDMEDLMRLFVTALG